MDVQGHCDERFAGVAEEFERNLAERGELGASVAVTVGGESVVDLWGGHADPGRTRPWEKDSLCVAMSAT
jgi:CubicO group peptidase (beta-lactamase class C family)